MSLQTGNVWLTTSGNVRFGLEGSANVRLQGSNNTVVIPSNMTITRNVVVTGNITSRLGGTEIITLVIDDDVNNLVLNVSPLSAVHSIVNIIPTSSIKITGINANTFSAGKKITLINKTRSPDSNCRMILFEHNSSNSNANNRINFKDFNNVPIVLLPQDTMELTLYKANPLTKWNCSGGSKPFATDKSFSKFYAWHVTPEFANNTNVDRNVYVYANVNGEQVVYAGFSLSSGGTTDGYNSMGCTRGESSLGYGYHFGSAKIAMNAAIPTSTNDFEVTVGVGSQSWYTNFVGWRADRSFSTTNWVYGTYNANSGSFVVSSIPMTFKEWLSLGQFINGTADNVDLFYSTDDGLTWTIIRNAITDNIPSGTVTLNHSLGQQVIMQKYSGTGTREEIIVASLLYQNGS